VKRVAGPLVVVLLLLPLVWQTVPGMIGTLRSVIQMAPRSRAQRRAAILGSWTSASEAVAARLRPGASVDLVVLEPRAAELAPFVAAELFPHPVWCYDGWSQWRARVPMDFMRHASGVNAAMPPPANADAIVALDTRHDPPLWLQDVRR